MAVIKMGKQRELSGGGGWLSFLSSHVRPGGYMTSAPASRLVVFA